MEENAKYINLAHHYLESLYVNKDFEEVLFMLDDACVWLGPCDDEHFSKKEIICEYLKESLKHVERSFLIDGKIHIATQCKEQINEIEGKDDASMIHVVEEMNEIIQMIVAYTKKGDLFQTVFIKADEAMYLAKKNGRNRIEVVN